jgi:creatinine amidohydrolase
MPQLLQELTRDEARALAPDALLVLPVGATEQHGPHLPVGVDTFAVEHIARAAANEAARHIPVVVAPTLPFGSSHHHLPFGGTLSLSTETYYRVLLDLLESLVTSGFRRVFILNGHGGNNELIQLAARDMALRHPASFGAASYWTVAAPVLAAAQAMPTTEMPGHSGEFETSLMLRLHPGLVRAPRPRRDDLPTVDPRRPLAYRAELHGAWQEIEGYTDSPAWANAEHGARYLDAIVGAVAAAFVEFHGRVTTATPSPR